MKRVRVSLLSSGFTFLVVIILYVIMSLAPFGMSSLACWDGNISMLDQFAYMKDCLNGENSIFYTFSKGLGGTYIGNFLYVLSSPFNLFLFLFSKENLHSFFDVVVALKLAFAAFTMSYFIISIFKEKIKTTFVILLSVGYAFCEYSWTKANVTMWNDGVYMLPLMLLGVHNIIENKSGLQLSLFTALSILFSFYTGAINCLFSAFWLLFEYSLVVSTKSQFSLKEESKTILKIGLKYAFAMLTGILMSCFLFLPCLFSLRDGRGHAEFSVLEKLGLISEFPSLIQNYTIGAVSGYDKVSLYCSLLALIGLLGIFAIKAERIKTQTKIVFACMILLVASFFCWNPLYFLFSLLKKVESYWSRYSYIGSFFITFSAAFCFSHIHKDDLRKFLKISILYTIVLLVLHYVKPAQGRTQLTAVFIIFISLVISFIVYNPKKNAIIAKIVLLLLVSFEICYNSMLILKTHKTNDVADFKFYVTNEDEQIKKIKNADKDFYRISQTTTRNEDLLNNRTANFNEGGAFNYWSISSYTTQETDEELAFFDKLGYKRNGDNMHIVTQSILPVDSLLGVKYVRSPYEIKGLLQKSFEQQNGKFTFENPYALPMAIKYPKSDIQVYDGIDNFVFHQSLYSLLLGKDVSFYIPLDKGIQRINKSDFVTFTPLLGNYSYYGRIHTKRGSRWDDWIGGHLNINNAYNTIYSQWLSPSVFYIPTTQESDIATIVYEADNAEDSIYEAKLYALDLNKFEEICNHLKNNTVSKMEMKNGYAYFECSATSDEKLFVSIPYDKAWKITVNGKNVIAEKFAGHLFSIPLDIGENKIEMKYRCPGFLLGCIFSLIGVGLLYMGRLYDRKLRPCT